MSWNLVDAEEVEDDEPPISGPSGGGKGKKSKDARRGGQVVIGGDVCVGPPLFTVTNPSPRHGRGTFMAASKTRPHYAQKHRHGHSILLIPAITLTDQRSTTSGCSHTNQ
ncbi:hypothetical protein E2C01_008041 [Portunus trituberculatus]|uniref:Uncharacterized protein n=1 Tax=Portunus trituberculatus TaxID=210409 RepID=A0A5B7D1Q7_PORTR|nr:hypothetical protein [Portunus trituberculatus]